MRRVLGFVLVVVGVVVVVGCSGGGGSGVSSSPSLVVGSPSVGVSSVVVSPSVFESFPSVVGESGDRAAVRAGWLEYWRVYDKFASDPAKYADMTELGRVAADDALTVAIREINELRQDGWRSRGGLRFSSVTVSDPVSVGGERTATVTYCIDTSELVVIDRQGKPVEQEGWRLQETATMREGGDKIWRMVQVRNVKVGQC